MNHPDLPAFYLELSQLITVGFSMDCALETLIQHVPKSFQKKLRLIKARIQSGESFSEAISSYPRYFNALHCAMIQMAEHSGQLGPVLEILGQWSHKNKKFKQQCRNALFYPIISLCGALCTLFLLTTTMLPKMALLYEQFHQTLPSSAITMLKATQWLGENWMPLLWIFFLLLGLIFVLQYYSPPFKKILHLCSYHCPLWHSFQSVKLSQQLSAQLAIMAQSGVPITQSLKLIQACQTNQIIREKIEHMQNLLHSGARLSEAFSLAGCFPELLISYIQTGEQTGSLGLMLKYAERYYADQLEQKTEHIIKTIEPCALVLIGSLVAWIAYCFYQPLITLQMF